MKYSFEETKNQAQDILENMEQRLVRMNRAYRACVKHGATEAAAKLNEEIDSLEQDLDCERDVFRQAFY